MMQTSTKPNTNITISTSTNQINFNTTEKNGISASTSAISSNYNSLINKPSINEVSLSGDLNSINLRIIDDATVSALSTYSSEKILEEMKKVIVVNELIGTEENPLIASDLKIGSYIISGIVQSSQNNKQSFQVSRKQYLINKDNQGITIFWECNPWTKDVYYIVFYDEEKAPFDKTNTYLTKEDLEAATLDGGEY